MPAPVPLPESPAARLRQGIGPWQPFTGHGVASFALAGFFRLLALQLLAALAVASLVAWGLHQTWFPVIQRALPQLPEVASIVSGSLSWPGDQPERLAQNPWLDVIVTPKSGLNAPSLGQTADLQLELLPSRYRIQGILGHFTRPYPKSTSLDLGRIPASAAWEAWQSTASLMAACSIAAGLLISWWLLASIYSLPAWILALLLSRPVNLGATWRMASAALLFGALLAAAGLTAYILGVIRLPGLLVVLILHFPIGIIWLAWGILRLPSGSRLRKSPAKSFRAA